MTRHEHGTPAHAGSHEHVRDTVQAVGHAHRHGAGDDAALADLLDLDGQVLAAHWAAILADVRSAVRGAPSRIVDLGAGSGVGTFALARAFDGARIVALDSSDAMLDRIRDGAGRLGLAGRVSTLRADLDESWPLGGSAVLPGSFELDGSSALDGPVDLTWASMSMHHLADPDRVLRDVFAATAPGGLVALVEFDAPMRVLPDDPGVGRPGLEQRCLDALAADRAHALPELGSRWLPRLAAAGFTAVGERVHAVDLRPGRDEAAARYAHLWLTRLRGGLAGVAEPEDMAALDMLLAVDGPHSVLRRDDLRVRGERTLTLGRRV